MDQEPIGLTLGAAFYGYTIGAALFGITITQAYHYFMTTTKYGAAWQLYIVIMILCVHYIPQIGKYHPDAVANSPRVLDTLHFLFAVHMMYTYLLVQLGDTEVMSKVVGSLKSMGSVQVFFTIFVQACVILNWVRLVGPFSTSINTVLQPLPTQDLDFFKKPAVVKTVWTCATGDCCKSEPHGHRSKQGSEFLPLLRSNALNPVFLIELQKIDDIKNFSLRFEYVIYVGFGATAFIDMGIAAAMCLMLHKSSPGTKRSSQIIVTLIQYIVGTGLLTSLGALLIMVLYIAWPNSLLYLGIEYSMTRLYAISVLALYNSQARLRDKLNQTRDLNGASMLYFAEPDKIITHHGGTESPVDMNGHAHDPQPRRGDTLDTFATPSSGRHLTRLFENLDAEDTLVERSPQTYVTSGAALTATASRSGRNGRHYTA
ncbi:hypothetical protein CC1G_15258 [Coprinopsis cinerea okayama7|uniref:DUF6534 domain-containing protein n=1 Tax=Coprinopsis cinerea (strain Okayama-7 / 130 / ATCC MYA-4618 / FGSC 9003) TaxID=240176 RepID=D6RPV7_COPC7|nr:hypothetical protein CC1G_15258 [Coprinopsis cinerea okayama7\|eukprot:XP_002910350.1 hypothetical protein CC1G_15258 [Coprinopsis cinerea okayama7\